MRKLPVEVIEKEKGKSQDYFSRLLNVLDIDGINCDVCILSQLMDTLSFAATNKNNFYSAGIPGAVDVLIKAIANYIEG